MRRGDHWGDQARDSIKDVGLTCVSRALAFQNCTEGRWKVDGQTLKTKSAELASVGNVVGTGAYWLVFRCYLPSEEMTLELSDFNLRRQTSADKRRQKSDDDPTIPTVAIPAPVGCVDQKDAAAGELRCTLNCSMK